LWLEAIVERELDGGWQTEVWEADGVVYRSAGPQSPAVLALLRHLEAVGFDASPRVVEPGFSPDGREMLRFVDAQSPQPLAWSDQALDRLGALLRELHDATSLFEAPPDAYWRPWFARQLPGARPVLGHGDLGPWNILARHGEPVAIIDWDNAGPVDLSWELAQAAWLNVQLHDDDVAELNGLPNADTRARQLRTFLDGYRLEASDREAFVDRMAEFAVHCARQEAINEHITAEATDAVRADGYPIMWGVTWRVRSASWILRHRALLEAAIRR
jgi:hypothetical protein